MRVATVDDMEQWEHMVVQAVTSVSNKRLVGYMPNGTQLTFDVEDIGMRRITELLNELGAQGWQLVSTDVTLAPNGVGAGNY